MTERIALQRRVLGTLVSTQVLGGVGLSAGAAVGSLLAEDVSGSATYAGLGGTFQVLGAALITIPMARIMAAHGRRPGLALGYALATLGAAGLIASAVWRSFPLLLVASIALGGATASNGQSRYAAADLSEPSRRGRDISVVVWATTIGSVLGPNLVVPGEPLADALGLPRLTGPFLFSLVALVIAVIVTLARLRPDPLVEARRSDEVAGPAVRPHGSVWRGLRTVAGHPAALLGMITMSLGHAVMVSVMVMTPLHMRHGHAELKIIGLVISVHILGMFALSPLTGLATDRFGGRSVAFAGAGILLVATLLASTAPTGHSMRLLVALFLLGLGWSCTLVSGSTLLTNGVPASERPGAQGASDLMMGLAGGGAGALAGVVVAQVSYRALALCALVLAVAIAVAALLVGRTHSASRSTTAARR